MPHLMVGQDSYIDLLRGRDELSRCSTCKVATHPFDQGFVAKRKPKHDLCLGTEGIPIISPRFRALLDDVSQGEVNYYAMPSGFFVIRPMRCSFLDLTGKNPRCTSFCETCGRMNGFHANIFDDCDMMQVGQKAVGETEILRTAQEFGPVGQKNFHLIVGDGLAKSIKDAKLKGVVFSRLT